MCCESHYSWSYRCELYHGDDYLGSFFYVFGSVSQDTIVACLCSGCCSGCCVTPSVFCEKRGRLERTGPQIRSQSGIPTQPPARLTEEGISLILPPYTQANMISVNHTGSKHPKAENILLDSGPQINLISRSELLHSIVYESKQAHSFNGAPVQTIGHGIFTMKLADINIDLPTLLLPTGEQLSFPLIVSGEYLRDKLHMSIFEHYQVPCYLHDADTKLPRINLNKINGYLTIPIN